MPIIIRLKGNYDTIFLSFKMVICTLEVSKPRTLTFSKQERYFFGFHLVIGKKWGQVLFFALIKIQNKINYQKAKNKT